MKKTITLSLALVSLAACAVELIVPKVDERTILRHPLDESRVAYQELEDGNASLLIGKRGDAHPYRVVDPLTIRGYRVNEIPEKEYSVSYTSGFTYNGADNQYVLGSTLNVTNRIVFTALGNRQISSYDAYEKNMADTGVGSMECADVKVEQSERQIIITVVKYRTGTYFLQDPVLYGASEGSKFGCTDLVDDLHVVVKDTVGAADLSTWRNWAKHSNDGNLGVDWYKYDALGTIRMKPCVPTPTHNMTNRYDIANHGIVFDGVGALENYYKLFYDSASTNLVLKAGQFYPIEVQARGFGALSDFKFTRIDKTVSAGVTNVELIVQVPDPNYSVNLVSIYYIDSLTNKTAGVLNWQLMPAGRLTKSGMNFTCNLTGLPGADKAQFFRFNYGGVDLASCCTIIRENVLMEDDVQISGNLGVVESITLSDTGVLSVLKPGGLHVVGDDGFTYELHINGGVATWTVVTP